MWNQYFADLRESFYKTDIRTLQNNDKYFGRHSLSKNTTVKEIKCMGISLLLRSSNIHDET